VSRLLPLHQINLREVLFIMVVLNFMAQPAARAQRYLTAFASVTEITTARHSEGLITGDFNGDGIIDLATYAGNQVRVFFQNRDSLSFRTTSFTVKTRILGAAAARLDGDRIEDIVLITENPVSVQVFLVKKGGYFYPSWSRELSDPFEKFLLADINSDKRQDIVFYGKKILGAVVFAGKGNGTFQAPETLFHEYSFSAMMVDFVHGVTAADVIASNWISNQLLVFSGIGKMKFSDPYVIQCSSEPALIKTAYIDPDINLDLVVGFPDGSNCETYLGDGLGGFYLSQQIKLECPPTALEVADVNGDGRDDIGVLCNAGRAMTVILNNGGGVMEENIPFAAGISPIEFRFVPHKKRHIADAVVLDTAKSRLRFFCNSNADSGLVSEKYYATGIKPAGVLTADINHDGWEDVVVANTQSKTISLFINQGNGFLGGQISYPLALAPVFLQYCSKDDTTAIVIATNPASERISVLEINLRSYSHGAYYLPTLGFPEILDVRIDRPSKNLHLFALEHEKGAGQSSLIEFEQISGSRFIEKNIPLKQPQEILSASMGDYDGDGLLEVVYMTYDQKNKREQMFCLKGLAPEQFSTPRLVCSFDEPEAAAPLLWTSDINDDGNDDLILNLGEPENSLTVFMGRTDTTLAAARSNIKSTVAVTSKDRLKILDMNGDGLPDIVLENNLKKTIQVYFGKGYGAFSPGTRIASSGGFGGFDLGDLNNDSIPELIFSDAVNGLLQVVFLEE